MTQFKSKVKMKNNTDRDNKKLVNLHKYIDKIYSQVHLKTGCKFYRCQQERETLKLIMTMFTISVSVTRKLYAHKLRCRSKFSQ